MEVDQAVIVAPQPSSFHYQPLDHSKPSIRFIKVLPQLTADGRIRCEVSHTTTGSEIVYRCLSYQWGEPNAATSREIELNGAPFIVRKNLYDFLRILWSNIGYNTILGTWAAGVWWIDAICIDQRNTLERNHQVSHMGTIYSEAEEVVVWLGLASIAKNKVKNLHDLAPSGSETGGIGSNQRGGTYLHDRRIVGRRVIRNEYWNRAWITQEIALAQSVSVLVDDLLYGFPELVDLLSLLDIPWRHTHFDQFVGIRSGTIDLSKRSLVDLLNHFRNRKCTLPQDRVFSLLSLCSDVNGSIRVDYNMSKDQLANQIM
ncbi:heterokaryon incompatibility protein-domain-containing protein, partial [Phaeosphaeria sp. MPI-PUGE-AT-0046c]